MVARNPTKCHPQSCHHDFTEGESHRRHLQYFEAPVEWINDFVISVVRVGVKVGCKLKKKDPKPPGATRTRERPVVWCWGHWGQ